MGIPNREGEKRDYNSGTYRFKTGIKHSFERYILYVKSND